MAKPISTLLQRLFLKRELRHWRTVADSAQTAELPLLRTQRNQARKLKTQLDRVLHMVDARLTQPTDGVNLFPVPHGTDWTWRPQLFRGSLPVPGMASVASRSRLGDEVTLHHDCQQSELSLRQIGNHSTTDLAPFGLSLDVFAFDGSYLSLVIELPPDAVKGLTKNHLIRLTTIVEMEKPLEIFARLNITHGPNTAQVLRELPLGQSESMVEFDLAYTDLNEQRIEKAWIDLIFEGPEMNRVVLRDVNLSRAPRAAV